MSTPHRSSLGTCVCAAYLFNVRSGSLWTPLGIRQATGTAWQQASCHKRLFRVVNTHTIHIVFKETMVQRVCQAIFNIEVWKENDVTCWERGPDISTDHSQRILFFICFSQN